MNRREEGLPSSDDRLVVRDVTIVDPDERSPSFGTVVLEAGRVKEVRPGGGSIEGPAEEVDGAGLFILPGLADAHVHAHREGRSSWHYPLYLAHGVTEVREMGTHLLSALSARSVRDDPYAPNVYWGSPPLDGPASQLPFAMVVENVAAARRAVRLLAELRFDFLKIYDDLEVDVLRALLEEATALGMPVDGHVPLASSPREAVSLGQRTIEHLTLVLEACIPGALAWIRQQRGRDSLTLLCSETVGAGISALDLRAQSDLLAEFAARGTWNVPTLCQLEGALGVPRFDDETTWRAVPNAVLGEWEKYARDVDPSFRRFGLAVLEQHMAIVRRMSDIGVPLLLGTDASTEPFVVPGASLHREMQLFEEAGISTRRILQAATTNAARHRAGPLEAPCGFERGAPANFLLLARDPRESLENLRALRYVVLRGTLITASQLRARVEALDADRSAGNALDRIVDASGTKDRR